MDEDQLLDFDYAKSGNPVIIKVVGVGGGGGNAVSHMFEEGIEDVSFLLCNTDEQALRRSRVPDQIVLGRKVTQGLGAGNIPEKARLAAEESAADIRDRLNDGTKMVFITAGMGGGTGTGAAPVIAGIAQEMGLLTIGIVTIPFLFELKPKIMQALLGVKEMEKNVDALLVINNEKLIEIFGKLSVRQAFKRADDTLTIAAKSIAEIITHPGEINLDFADVQTTMRKGGVALMSNGYGEGENRLRIALDDALHSPLLGNKNIKRAKRILFNICSSEEHELMMDEMDNVRGFMAETNPGVEVIWGTAIDNTLGPKVKVTLLATGFTANEISDEVEREFTDDTLTDGERRRRDEEERRRREEEEYRLKKLIDEYYGDTGNNISSSRVHIEVLAPDELDNDVLISILEDTPTYMRKPKLMEEARAKMPPAPEIPVPAEEASPSSSDKPIIRF
ncbi:cell division protein FtsZ [Parabacteroides sp. PF5-6]|uniref:cell division protein FtsZ n=1 Tax=Parabacteroides sp. PF5-6 TaxID=1742403 RepID=UPI00240546C7|nr:cell division protein FtsZ [Parabacteroides sp. PF5-6]MDF9829248.1 cell division protein FtsZ [Parabacteroides sp. PF5-6]